MNRFVASAGVLVMGLAGASAANVTGLTPQQTTKWWSVSASLRGFYDDNVSQASNKEGSPGVEFEPSVSLNLPRDQTLITAKYTFRLNYYTERPDEPIDQHHQFNMRVNHRFSERYTLNFEDSFVYSNEPEVIAGGNVQTGYGRTDSTAVRNFVPVTFNARLTRLIGLELGYQNSFYDYEEDNTDLNTYVVIPPNPVPVLIPGVGSRSALLDRIEHEFHLEGQWHFNEMSVGFVGYQFTYRDYTSDGEVSSSGQLGTDRDSRSHYGYLGVAHTFSRQLSGIARAGIEAIDYFPLNESDLSPYLDLTGTYEYLPGSNVKLGAKVAHAPTDLVGSGGEITRDQLASAVYGSWNHRITPRIMSNLYAQYLYSIFNGGEFDGDTESFVNFGLTLTYQFNQHVSANVAYAFDTLTSDVPDREFDRNRVWAGFAVTY